MIGIDGVVLQITGLERQDVERWIAERWVRPDGPAGRWAFREIDVARVRLILTLRDEMEVDERALPVVLGLLDQLYDLRRRVREMEKTRN